MIELAQLFTAEKIKRKFKEITFSYFLNICDLKNAEKAVCYENIVSFHMFICLVRKC